MLKAIIKDQALNDIQKAYNYLEEQQEKLGENLLSRLDEYLEIIELNPYLFKEGYKKVRQVRIKPFQYILHYKIYKADIVIIQLFQAKQNPKKRALK